MKRCDDLKKKYFKEIKSDAYYCAAKDEGRLCDCPKARLKGDVSQVCWKVEQRGES